MNLNEKVSKHVLLKDLAFDEMVMKDKGLAKASTLELQYLKSLDMDKLLAGFLEIAGLESKAKRYDGWEVTEIQGHTLGHYLVAISQAYGTTKDNEWLTRINYIIDELARCQREDGYLFASDQEIFDRVDNKEPAWVPWYTMHKILSGILAAYRYTGGQQAYTIMTKLGTWIYNRNMKWDKELQARVLAVEYGGMNDCLYDLYIATKDSRFAEAAHRFDELSLFEPLYNGKDILNGLHANTTIPKIIGALKRYVALGENEVFYLDVAKNFWDMVVDNHTYITGGNSEWEHFGQPCILDEERTSCNCETCNTYNMLKLTKLLFQVTKDKKYADYYERAFINAIYSSQNPNDGMTTYFQPMAVGYFKVYSTPYDSFWCCTGSGMESFTKLGDGVGFYGKDTFYLNRFVESEITWSEKKIKFEIKGDLTNSEKIEIVIKDVNEQDNQFTLAIRLPEWIKEKEEILINGENVSYTISGGYAHITRVWDKQDLITVILPMELKVHSLPDNQDVVAFTYGPFVLSAGLGMEKLSTTYTGIDVLVPTQEVPIKDYIILENIKIEEWKKNAKKYLQQTEGKIEFTLANGYDEPLVFGLHFAKCQERYGIYFRLYEKDSQALKDKIEKINQKLQLQKLQVDTIPIGNDQYELAHKIRGFKTDTAMENGHKCRHIKEDGWFSYEMEVEDIPQALCVTYSSNDAGNECDIYINDTLFIHEEVVKDGEAEFYTKEYPIPSELIHGSNTITVKFQNRTPQNICRIYDELYIKRH